MALGLAAALRLPLLGGADFQGDEAYALLLARGVLHGQDDILLVHMKGPVEALLPAGPLALTGVISEWVARLPFAVASLAIILGVWALAGRLVGGAAGRRAGFVAGLALAVDGILLAFGRIVQYQSMVLLMSLTALWLCWLFYQGAPARPYLAGAAFCAAVGVLAHYDGAFVAPALAWLVLAGGLRRGWRPAQWLGALAPPVALGLALTLSFYLPFVAHEHFGRTLAHLGTRSGQGSAGLTLFNNLPDYARLASFYITRYQLAATALALLGGLLYWLASRGRPRWLAWPMAALLAVATPAAVLWPELFARGPDASLAGLAVAPPLLLLALAPGLRPGLRALVIWLGAPLIANGFLLADPRTHFYTLHLPATLLAALAATRLMTWLRLRGAGPLRAPLAAGGAALLALALPYAHLAFIRPEPEYERAYPATMLPLYAPLDGAARSDDDGYFGFPRRDGWKAVGDLLSRGELGGVVGTNQEIFTTGWYVRGQMQCARAPDYYFTVSGVRPLYIPPGYQLYGAVLVGGVRALEIYSRAPVDGPPRLIDAAGLAGPFDAAPVPDFPLRRLLSGVVPQRRLDAAWPGGFGLRGYDLDRASIGPGERAFLTLYWRAETALPASYQPVVQIRDAQGRPAGEAAPVCTTPPASSWHTNYVNDTPFAIPGDLPPGSYSLHAGIRDAGSGAWVGLGDGQELLPLTSIVVAGP